MGDFYPRSPCGERQGWPAEAVPARHISIHALLAESDDDGNEVNQVYKISIHALLAESDEQAKMFKISALSISIHALLAESDRLRAVQNAQINKLFLSTLSLRRATIVLLTPPTRKPDFYPRSPCGERLGLSYFYIIKITDFYPRSPCGERLSA